MILLDELLNADYNFPGLYNEKFGKLFLFRDTDLREYLKKETCEMRQLLYAYKIKF